MEELVKEVDQILNQYGQECMGNRLNQFTFMSLKNIVLGKIANYKVGNKKNEVNSCKPIVKNAVDKSTEEKIIRK